GAIINAAAYTQVDRAEEEVESCRLINGEAPGVIAGWCAKKQIPFIHYSTDYVFSGNGDKPWREDDPVSPLSAYGQSKLLGEQTVAKAGGKWLIFRTSWIYDAKGKNFLQTMLRLAKEKDEINVVADQIGAPTYATHLAAATLRALDKALRSEPFPSGIYHLCNRGETSWHGFAEAIIASAKNSGISIRVNKVNAIQTKDYPTPARRPQNSRLCTDKAMRVFATELPDWGEGLSECMTIYRKLLRNLLEEQS
ncbi:MAG: dTDP-4-dehydrorhamnose reductase, partial [Bdellovibrionota bacterium]